ncbi:MAG: MBL fold metallo-hydrolase [Methanomicrobiaceae archaeon]|nr:MBL fold metallo-hydrolase [Methanomicrobiaceae archaeon]
MLIEKVKSAGIAHNSYFIGSNNEAAVIDPRRDCDVYLDIARANNMRITHIFETHRNEDYVIGSQELASLSGAEIYHGAQLDFAYGRSAFHGDEFRIGELELTVIETPGHTEESLSVVAREKPGSEPLMVFTGDALLAGDAGRTDFYGPDNRTRMSTLLYESIFEKILPLGDGVIVCPAHGAGSVCGTNIADREYTTIGFEKTANPLLGMTRDEFIRAKSTEHHYYPPYFRKMEELNKNGAPRLRHLPEPMALSAADVEQLRSGIVQMIDIRSVTGFAGAHIPGSLSLPREILPVYAGWLIRYEDPIVLIDDYNHGLHEIVSALIRLGYDNVIGYLANGFPAWFRSGGAIASVGLLDAVGAHEKIRSGSPFILDVRAIEAWETVGHIPGARHVYLGELPDRIAEIPAAGEIIVYCDAGFKGNAAASLLEKAGHDHVWNLLGGMGAWQQAGFSVEQ